MAEFLTQADVQKLLDEPSGERRAETAGKVAREFQRGDLSDSERTLAESIFRAMMADTELRVREALSIQLKDSGILPKDIALRLCRDVDQVALPMLECSSVLGDEDLIEIVRSQDVAKQTAIARRDHLGADLADALVDTENREVVRTLAANDGAEIAEGSFQKVIDRFGDDDGINDALVHRAKLPVTVAERLVTRISDSLRDHLVTHHELSADMAADLVLQSRERATVGLLGSGSAAQDVAGLVRHLQENGRLTPSIILRALCMGDMSFFEQSMAIKAEIPVENVRILVHDAGSRGLVSIYDKARLPSPLFPVVRAAVDVAHEIDYDGGEHDRERYSRRMIELILTQFDEFETDNLDYLLAKLSQLNDAAGAPEQEAPAVS